MPAVSIILTSYNHQHYLRQAIESALDQSFQDFELLIWDDASTDGSWEIIQSYADPRIRSFQNQSRQRPVFGLNRAISQFASGEFIAIHHSDDVWERGKLEQQVDFLRSHPAHAASFSRALIIDQDGLPFTDESHFYYSVFDQPNRSRQAWLNYFFMRGNALCHPSALIRRSFFDACGLYRRGTTIVTDMDLWIRMCLRFEIHVVQAKLVQFRILGGDANSSMTPGSSRRTMFELFHLMNHYLQLSDFDELVAVFPEARKYERPGGFDARFVLGMIAVETRPFPSTCLFGLNLLLEAFSDPARAENLNRLYGFDIHQLHELKGASDIFHDPQLAHKVANLEGLLSASKQRVGTLDSQVASLQASLRQSEAERARLRAQAQNAARRVESLQASLDAARAGVRDLRGRLGEMQAGRGWRLLSAIRRLRLLVAPPGSTRERLWYALLGHRAPKAGP